MEIRACFAFLFIWGVVAKGADYSGTGEYYHEKGSDYEHDKGSDYAKSYDHNSYDKGSDYAKSYDHYSDKGSDDSGSEVEKQLYFPKMSSAGDLKAVLTDASQGANLGQFAHKLLAFSERTERFIPTGDCGLGVDMTQAQLLSGDGIRTCSALCMIIQAGCLDGPTVRLNSEAQTCQCAWNIMERIDPVLVTVDPMLPEGCVDRGSRGVVFNALGEAEHPMHEQPAAGCDGPPAAGLYSHRTCVCSL
eukprot:Polyplicarium_translucidae@DN3334_c0_g3_i2.p1